MSRYDFKSLSSRDFEELIRDLLQAEWGLALEAFRTGRDHGIDLRYAGTDNCATVIQCKHYANSSFAKLIAHLRNVELPKIRRLNPTRYVVATSVGLTPGNKDEVVVALRPFVSSARDVIGADDVEGLLSRHPDVERANFKLWLTSTSVLERVLHNASVCQTEFELDRLKCKLPLFVSGDVYHRAAQILDKSRIVIVTGVPGIGKTTLAEMLLYAHLEGGFEPVVIRAEIAEAKNMFKVGRKQVFYFDDFLGQTFLGDRREYLGRNQDVAIVDFMEMVRRSPHSRFILTTREHILSGALQVSERLANSQLLDHRCILELGDYSFGSRARILYNHLYFSDLPQGYKDEILKEDFFLEVIRHEHFNPRLIEWMSSYSRVNRVPITAYRPHISTLLSSPQAIWAHAFSEQISDAARHLLLSMRTLGTWIDVVDLEPVFVALHRHNAEKYRCRTASGDFHRALRELDGAFLSYDKGCASFLNPSIAEFVASMIVENRECAEDLVRSATRFRQLVNLWELASIRPASPLGTLLGTETGLVIHSLSRLMDGRSMRWERMPDGRQRGYPIDLGYEAKLAFLVDLAATDQWGPVAVMADKLSQKVLGEWDRQGVDFASAVRVLASIAKNTWYLDHGGREVYRRIQHEVVAALTYARSYDWIEVLAFAEKALEWCDGDESQLRAALHEYESRGVFDERCDCSTLEELTGLRESLEELREKFGLDLGYEIDQIDEEIVEREDSLEDRELDPGTFRNLRASSQEVVTEDDVREMFQSLREAT